MAQIDVKEIALKYQTYIVETRRTFHQYPEVAFEEKVTCGLIVKELERMGLFPQVVAGTGVLCDITGGRAEADAKGHIKTVALRADIDALRVTEKTEVSYASKHPGNMHACGHDCHIAGILTAARMLNDIKEELTGNVRLIFQPAEEVSGGAIPMMKAGALDGVDTIYGAHVWSEIPAGKISVDEGSRMASADFFTITIKGVGAHGAMPELGVDSILAGAAVVQNLQSLVSRELTPLEPYVLTIGEFHGGTASNVLAEQVVMQGTVRTFNNETRQKIPSVMERIIKNTAASFKAEGSLDYRFGASALENDPQCSKIAAQAVKRLWGEETLYRYPRVAVAEDYAEYLKVVPGVFAFIGTGNPDKKTDYPQHSCYYNVDEDALIKGAAVAAQYVLEFLESEGL